MFETFDLWQGLGQSYTAWAVDDQTEAAVIAVIDEQDYTAREVRVTSLFGCNQEAAAGERVFSNSD